MRVAGAKAVEVELHGGGMDRKENQVKKAALFEKSPGRGAAQNFWFASRG